MKMNKGMRWVAAIALFLFFGCGGQKTTPKKKKAKLSTPEETFKAFQQAIEKEKFEKVYDLQNKEQQQQMDEQAKKINEKLKSNPPKGKALEAMKAAGITDAQLQHPTGRDMFRYSLAFTQIMMERFAKKGEEKPNVIKNLREQAAQSKLLEVRYSKDKQKAFLTFGNEQGKKKHGIMVKEDGQWKLAKNKRRVKNNMPQKTKPEGKSKP